MNTYVVCNYHTARGHFCIPVGKQKRPGGIPLGLFCFPKFIKALNDLIFLSSWVININTGNGNFSTHLEGFFLEKGYFIQKITKNKFIMQVIVSDENSVKSTTLPT